MKSPWLLSWKEPSSALATRSTRSSHLQLSLEDYLPSGTTGFGNALQESSAAVLPIS